MGARPRAGWSELRAVQHTGRRAALYRRSPGQHRAGLSTGSDGCRMTTAQPAVVAVVGSPIAPAPAIARRRGPRPWGRRLLRLASVLAALGLWQVLTANHVRAW